MHLKKKKCWTINTLPPLLFFSFLVFNLLPVSLLSNTNQNTQNPLYLEVLFYIAEVRLNCLLLVQISHCPSLVQDEWGAGPIQWIQWTFVKRTDLYASYNLGYSCYCTLSHLTEIILTLADLPHVFQVLVSSWNFPNLMLIVASRCKTDKTDCVAIRRIWE